MKLIKWIGGIIITLLILIVLAIIILPNIVDPNDYRGEISTLVKDSTGRDLTLAGNLELSVFPWLGIKTEGLSLSQPDGIEGDMVSVDTAQLRLKFLPLLSKRVEVDTIVLTKPQVNLITLKNGLDSFAGLAGGEEEAVETETSTTSSVSLAVQGIEITDGLVVIDDRKAGTKMELSNLSLVTGNLLGGSLASVKAAGQLKDSASPDITKFDLSAQASINPDNFNVQLADLIADVIQGEQNIKLSLGDMSFTDAAIINAKDIVVNVVGDIAVNATIPSVSANMDTQAASMPSLTAEVENLKAQLKNVEVSSFIDKPSLQASLVVEQFDAAKLLKAMEIDFKPADATAMTSVALSANLKGDMNSASISNLDVSLDQTKLTGKAGIRDFDKPKITFDLNLNEINLDRYLPETTEEVEEESNSGDALAVPMELFSDIDANGSFKAKKFTSGGVSLTDIDVLVKSSQGNVSITPKAKLYDGELAGVIAYNKKGDTSTLKIKNDIGIVQLGKLLLDADVTDRFEGVGKLAIDLLITDVNGKQSNEGVFTLSASDGQVKGVNINKIIDQASSAYSGLKKLGGNQEPDETEVASEPSDLTEFADLSGTFNMKDFLITNNDLKMVAPGFNVTGQGQMNVEKNTIDYTINVAISDKISGSLAGKSIPVRCKGALDAPSCLPDMKAMYKLFLKSKLDDKKSALKDKLFGSLSDDSTEEAVDSAPKTKKERKDELKKKLLKGLFD